MAVLRYRATAEADLDEIRRFIARDNPTRALSFVRELRQTCRTLAETPKMGRQREELRPGLRSFPHGDYLIFYRLRAEGISVMRIVHGKRQLSRLF